VGDYNGWKNRQTWNVALWLSNDERTYRQVRDYAIRKRRQGSRIRYSHFIKSVGLDQERTPDGIAYLGTRLDYAALDELVSELGEE
jgi:hypothetical protein